MATYDRNQCFKYKGKYYLSGTVVKLNEKWMKAHGLKTTFHIGRFRNDWLGFDIKSVYSEFYRGHIFNRLCSGYAEMPENIPEELKYDVSGRYIGYLSNHTGNWGDASEYDGNEVIWDEDLEDAIEEIVEPVVRTKENCPDIKGCQIPEVIAGWVVYIALMLLTIIFKERGAIWTMFTVAWLFVRHIMINNANGYK